MRIIKENYEYDFYKNHELSLPKSKYVGKGLCEIGRASCRERV